MSAPTSVRIFRGGVLIKTFAHNSLFELLVRLLPPGPPSTKVRCLIRREGVAAKSPITYVGGPVIGGDYDVEDAFIPQQPDLMQPLGVPLSKPQSVAVEDRRRYESFRKKVLRRENYVKSGDDPLPPVVECQICAEKVTCVEAARIVDLNQCEALYQQYLKDPEHFPLSINDANNGILACKTCHYDFDSPKRLIQLKGDGTLLFFAEALKIPKYKRLRESDAKVAFAAKIGTKDYPSAKFIEWATRQNKIEKKKRKKEEELAEPDEESDDEDSPKHKKPKVQNWRHQRFAVPSGNTVCSDKRGGNHETH